MYNSEVTIDVATNESTFESSGQVDTESTLETISFQVESESTLEPINGQVDLG